MAVVPAGLPQPRGRGRRSGGAVPIGAAPAPEHRYSLGLAMSLDAAARLTEILLALALIQQGLEHLRGFREERVLFGVRTVLCAALILGVAAPWPLVGLAGLSLLILHRFQGPYNGGSDRMGLLALWCLTLSRLLPTAQGQELAFGYLGAQLVLSYVIAGGVKIANPDWRSGRALRDVFQFS